MEWQANQYIEDVLSGHVVACHWIKQACQRQLDDLRDGPARGLHFDEGAAERVLKFFGILKHSKGEWAKGGPGGGAQYIKLEPWEQFLLWVIFGWKREDGTRRFRTGYVEIARKNGKSLIGSGIGLYLLASDLEPSAEIYAAATKKDQAKIIWTEAARMAKKAPMLAKRLQIFGEKNPKSSVCNINMPSNGSKFEPLGADSDTLDGLNVHGAIVDEVHAHKNGDMWDVLETATGARRQPFIFAVTTAGHDRQSLCWQLNEHAKKILDRIIADDQFFAAIYTLDKGDDWQDETKWIKANPNLGVSKKWDNLREKCERAKQMPSRQNAFKRLELDIWTQSETKWMPLEHWQTCGIPIDYSALAGRPCCAGLDLSSTLDLTALDLVWPPEPGSDVYLSMTRFWVPEENVYKRVHDDRVPYDVWIQQGFIVPTPGNVVDYDWILADLEKFMKQFHLLELAFDRWGSQKVIADLQNRLGFVVDEVIAKRDGKPLLIEFGQGYASMSPPMKALERLVMGHQIAHGNNPVLNWMADNVVASFDAAGNIKPDKQKSREKIDGIVALIMALDRATRNATVKKSIYETQGL